MLLTRTFMFGLLVRLFPPRLQSWKCDSPTVLRRLLYLANFPAECMLLPHSVDNIFCPQKNTPPLRLIFFCAPPPSPPTGPAAAAARVPFPSPSRPRGAEPLSVKFHNSLVSLPALSSYLFGGASYVLRKQILTGNTKRHSC